MHQQWALFQSLSNVTKNKQIVKVCLSQAKCPFRETSCNSNFEFRNLVSSATESSKSRSTHFYAFFTKALQSGNMRTNRWKGGLTDGHPLINVEMRGRI